jgi:hypothetical protein
MKNGFFLLTPFILMSSIVLLGQVKDPNFTAHVQPRPESLVLEQIPIPEIPPCPIKTVNKGEYYYYHEQFQILSELALDKAPEDKSECFRIFQFGWFNPSTAFFFKRDGKYFVRFKNIPNCSYWNKEATLVTREAELAAADWMKIRSLLERLNFWNLGRYQQLYEYQMPMDPSTRVIEAYCGGQYHCVERSTGNATLAGETVEILFQMAGKAIMDAESKSSKKEKNK